LKYYRINVTNRFYSGSIDTAKDILTLYQIKPDVTMQSDYLLRQLEQMMQALVSLIRKLTGMKDPNEEEVRTTTDAILKEQLNLTLSDVLKIQNEDIADNIIALHKLNAQNAELLADILVINAKVEKNSETSIGLLRRALNLYEWSDKKGNTYSSGRIQKIDEIKTTLKTW